MFGLLLKQNKKENCVFWDTIFDSFPHEWNHALAFWYLHT